MKCFLFTAVLFLPFTLPTLFAQTQDDVQSYNAQKHVITVVRNGTVFAKPDVGILAMSIHSTAPIAEEAVAENGKKAKSAEDALTALGFASADYKLTPVIFGQQAAGPYHVPNSDAVTVYEATQYVYVFFDSAALGDVVSLTAKSAAIMEALRKAGAVPANLTGPRFGQAQGGMIVYAIKDSSQYERQALQIAIGRARDAAEDIAKGMSVQIAGVRNVKSGALGGNYLPHSGIPYLEGLPYRFYSVKSDEVEISANAAVDYDFK